MVGKPRVGRELGPADGLAHRWPVLAGLEAGEGQITAVLRRVGAREGIGPHRISGRWRPRAVQRERERDGLAHGPESRPQEGHVDDCRLTGSLAVEERTHDAARDRHAADGVAEPWSGRDGHQVVFGTLGAEGDAGPGPECERVVRALVGVRPAVALPGAADVDDVRTVDADVVEVDLELLAHAGELVGEEDVGGGCDLVEDLEAFCRGEVERKTPLAAVRVLEQHVHVGGDHRDLARGQAAHRIAPFDVLDLDDVGAPVGEQCRRRRHERVLRDLEDANALHHCRHVIPPITPRSGKNSIHDYCHSRSPGERSPLSRTFR